MKMKCLCYGSQTKKNGKAKAGIEFYGLVEDLMHIETLH